MISMSKSKKSKSAKTLKDLSDRILYSIGKIAGSFSTDLRTVSKPFSDGYKKGRKS